MQRIDNWQSVFPLTKDAEPEKPDPESGPAYGTASTRKLAQLASAKIFAQLESTVSPAAAHLYLAEGFPWINVVFDKVVGPAMVEQVGSAIAAGCDRSSIYFHALGANDVRFLLDIRTVGTENDAELPAEQYGVPLDQLLGAWAQYLNGGTNAV